MSVSTKELFSIIGEQLVQLKQMNNLVELLKKDNESKSKEISSLKSSINEAKRDIGPLNPEAEEDVS